MKTAKRLIRGANEIFDRKQPLFLDFKRAKNTCKASRGGIIFQHLISLKLVNYGFLKKKNRVSKFDNIIFFYKVKIQASG